MLVNEIDRIKEGPRASDETSGMVKVKYAVDCNGNAGEILARAKEILLDVLQATVSGWPELQQWSNVLPDWFFKAFAKEMTDEEALLWIERWRAMPRKQQVIAEQKKGWSFSNWIGWFNPNERCWYWWDASIENANTISVTVLSTDSQSPYGALKWLFIACGAKSLDEG